MSESRGENQNSHSDFNYTDDATWIIFLLPTPTPFSADHVSVFLQGAGSFPDFFLWKENMFLLFRL